MTASGDFVTQNEVDAQAHIVWQSKQGMMDLRHASIWTISGLFSLPASSSLRFLSFCCTVFFVTFWFWCIYCYGNNVLNWIELNWIELNWIELNTRSKILYLIRWHTGSQWSSARIGVICSRCLRCLSGMVSLWCDSWCWFLFAPFWTINK